MLGAWHSEAAGAGAGRGTGSGSRARELRRVRRSGQRLALERLPDRVGNAEILAIVVEHVPGGEGAQLHLDPGVTVAERFAQLVDRLGLTLAAVELRPLLEVCLGAREQAAVEVDERI